MKIVFDVVVDGERKETLHPAHQRLQDIRGFIQREADSLIRKYGTDVHLNRRIIYK